MSRGFSVGEPSGPGKLQLGEGEGILLGSDRKMLLAGVVMTLINAAQRTTVGSPGWRTPVLLSLANRLGFCSVCIISATRQSLSIYLCEKFYFFCFVLLAIFPLEQSNYGSVEFINANAREA